MVWNTILCISLHYIHYIEQYLQGVFGHCAWKCKVVSKKVYHYTIF